MKKKKLNAVHVWKQLADLAVPGLRLSVIERAVYFHLLRHSRLEEKARLRFSIRWLARSARLSAWTARRAVRSLVAKGALRLIERSKAGHLVEVRLPEEIRAVGANTTATRSAPSVPGVDNVPAVDNLEVADFLATREVREAIHRREGGRCFYCSRRLSPKTRCLDHVVPLAQMGGNSYRNLVSSCGECNSLKAERRAEDFLRWLFREGHLSRGELSGRLRALAGLAAGKLRPPLESGKLKLEKGRDHPEVFFGIEGATTGQRAQKAGGRDPSTRYARSG